MKNVFLKIYPEQNLGDDLFLKIILERYPNSVFYVLGRKELYKYFLDHYNNLVVVDRLESVNFLDRILFKFSLKLPFKYQPIGINYFLSKQHKKMLSKIDCFVSLGGSMFIEETHKYQKTLLYYNWINNEFSGKPKFYIGCNFGPYLTKQFHDGFFSIFKNSTDTSFREAHSKLMFGENFPARVNPDIVFGLNYVPQYKNNKDSIGFVLIDPRIKISDSYNYANYIDEFSKIIEYYLKENKKVFLFSFCSKENDEIVINDLCSQLKNGEASKIFKVFYDGDVSIFLEKYSQVQYMFCGRFHSLILSMLFGHKIFPLSYSSKMNNTLDDLGYRGNIIDLEKDYFIEVENLENQFNMNVYNIDNEQQSAKDHFLILDHFLNS